MVLSPWLTSMNIIIGITVDINICRKRSNGTHFSRAHVAQLLSDNSKLWDVVSVNSDLSALDLEQSQVTSRYVHVCDVCMYMYVHVCTYM